MNTKGVIFDFGFTLFEFKNASVANYLNSYRQGLSKSIDKLKNIKIIEDDEIEKLFIRQFTKERNTNFKNSIKTNSEVPTHNLFRTVIEKLGLEKLNKYQYQELADLYHSHEETQWVPLKNTRKTLEGLKKKHLKLAVLSNHPNHNSIENVLKKYNFLSFFDTIVTSAKFGTRKPDPEIFSYTLANMGVKDPSACFMIGDEYGDIVGGHRAGLKPILYKRRIKFPFEREISLTDYIQINDISEILNHIL
ncbi:MAG: HAD family hydrolase [Promethearchaeota archaeon]|nr:MAG: HAD family hydrolase [Candidatus Lokiarchaeota archaeon]